MAVLAGGSVTETLRSGDDAFVDPASESARATDSVERLTGRRAQADVVALVERPTRAAAARAAQRVAAVARADAAVAVAGPIEGSRSHGAGRAYVPLTFRPGSDEAVEDAVERIRGRLQDQPGVALGGRAATAVDVRDQVREDLTRAELLAGPILLLLSIWIFRGVVAAAIPLAVGAVVIVGTFLGLRIAAELTSVSVFAVNLVTALGLALAIDYSLLVVTRWREEAAERGWGADALRATLRTAGRTVLLSATTIAASVATLFVFPQRFMDSMAIGGILTTGLALVAALVVLPALLVMLGPRVDALPLRRRRAEGDGWTRLAQRVMRRPVLVAAAATLVLAAAAIPAARMEFVDTDATVLPEGTESRRVQESAQRDLGPGRLEPIIVVARDAGRGAVADFAREAASLPGVAAVRPPVALRGSAWLVEIVPRSAARTEVTRSLVGRVRDLPAPFDAGVGGEAASFVDQQDSIADHLPLAAAALVTISLIAIFLLTRSLIVPIKALVFNAVTIAAALGVLVVIFQDGRLESPLGYTSQGALEATQPILLCVIAFGLSTDYGIFVLSRIREAYDNGESTRRAVAIGIGRTGRVVTAAALLLAAALATFATSEIVFVKEVGLGIAAAVLIDASIVRALLLPSLMALLGRWNWWAPGRLARPPARPAEPRAAPSRPAAAAEEASFMWGVATSSYQVEGGVNEPAEPRNNWFDWQEEGRAERCGEALRFWDDPDVLLERAAGLGCNGFRMSIEWARVEPDEGADSSGSAALDHYADILIRCRELGMEPVVTLQHFTHPRWLGPDAWLEDGTEARFAGYARRCVRELGRRLELHGQAPVRWWITLNEPLILTLGTYFLGIFPGTGRGVRKSIAAYERMLAAHCLGYDAVHDVYAEEGWDPPLVSTNASSTTVVAMDALMVDTLLARERRVTAEDLPEYLRGAHVAARKRTAAAKRLNRLAWVLDAFLDRWALRETTRPSDVLVRALYGSRRDRKLDYLAFDYYDPVLAHQFVPRGRGVRRLRNHRFFAEPWEQVVSYGGFEAFLRQAYLQAPDRPILVAENGLCTPPEDPRPDGIRRPEFVRASCAAVQRVRAEGIPVAGYFHWTIADNYEWGSYAPRFGLYGVDRRDGVRIMETDKQNDDAAGAYRDVIGADRQGPPSVSARSNLRVSGGMQEAGR